MFADSLVNFLAKALLLLDALARFFMKQIQGILSIGSGIAISKTDERKIRTSQEKKF